MGDPKYLLPGATPLFSLPLASRGDPAASPSRFPKPDMEDTLSGLLKDNSG